MRMSDLLRIKLPHYIINKIITNVYRNGLVLINYNSGHKIFIIVVTLGHLQQICFKNAKNWETFLCNAFWKNVQLKDSATAVEHSHKYSYIQLNLCRYISCVCNEKSFNSLLFLACLWSKTIPRCCLLFSEFRLHFLCSHDSTVLISLEVRIGWDLRTLIPSRILVP